MKFVNISLVILLVSLFAADALNPSGTGAELRAAITSTQDSEGIQCHCPAHEEKIASKKTYIIDCSSDEKTIKKFHNKSKIIITLRVLSPNNTGEPAIYSISSHNIHDWILPVETPPPRHA